MIHLFGRIFRKHSSATLSIYSPENYPNLVYLHAHDRVISQPALRKNSHPRLPIPLQLHASITLHGANKYEKKKIDVRHNAASESKLLPHRPVQDAATAVRPFLMPMILLTSSTL